MNMPRIPHLHPRSATLNRYADRTLAPTTMRRVGAHVIGCRNCREVVDQIHDLQSRARADVAPVASQEMLDRIHARRQAGERVILPVAETPSERFGSRWRIAAAAAICILAGGAAMLLSRSATAAGGNGSLSFLPSNPQPGANIEATYRPSERFGKDSVLMLRARFVSATRDVPSGFESTLPTVVRLPMERTDDGAFHVRFSLPANAAYSAFAIEDSGATRLDANHGRRWELLAYGADGHPRYDALLTAVVERAGWDARHEAARVLVAQYPDSIQAWHAIAFSGNVALGASDSDAAASYRSKLAWFDEGGRREPHPSLETMANLYAFSLTLQDSARLAYWRERVMREAPHSRVATTVRAVHAIERLRPDVHALARALPELDQIWNEVGAVDPSFTTFGLQSAIAARDPSAVARWGKRYSDMTRDAPSSREWVGSELVKYPQSRAEGLRILRSILVPLDIVSDPQRGLRQTAAARQRETDELRAETLQHIGEALLADHEAHAALDSLQLAASVSWNLERFRGFAAAALAVGDTAAATRMLALVVSDPVTAATFEDSARVLLGRNVSDTQWTQRLAEATTTMQSRVLALSTHHPMQGDRVRLLTAGGEKRTFAQLADSHVTVVAFGADLEHAGSPVDLHKMQRLSASLAQEGARLVVIALHPRTAGMPEAIRKRGLSIDVYFDEYHEADRAFDAYGFPIYCVVDARGTIRYSYSEVSQLRVQVRALAQEMQLARAQR